MLTRQAHIEIAHASAEGIPADYLNFVERLRLSRHFFLVFDILFSLDQVDLFLVVSLGNLKELESSGRQMPYSKTGVGGYVVR